MSIWSVAWENIGNRGKIYGHIRTPWRVLKSISRKDGTWRLEDRQRLSGCIRALVTCAFWGRGKTKYPLTWASMSLGSGLPKNFPSLIPKHPKLELEWRDKVFFYFILIYYIIYHHHVDSSHPSPFQDVKRHSSAPAWQKAPQGLMRGNANIENTNKIWWNWMRRRNKRKKTSFD